MIPKLYSKLQYAVKNLIQDNLGDGPYCLTTDIWSSAALESYLSVTMHFITQDFHASIFYHWIVFTRVDSSLHKSFLGAIIINFLSQLKFENLLLTILTIILCCTVMLATQIYILCLILILYSTVYCLLPIVEEKTSMETFMVIPGKIWFTLISRTSTVMLSIGEGSLRNDWTKQSLCPQLCFWNHADCQRNM